MSRWILAIILTTVWSLLSAIGIIAAQDTRTLTVFAATSLSDAFTEIGTNFKATHRDVDVVFNFGSSSTLATQWPIG